MAYKFERLDIWRMALEYTDLIYAVGKQLPRSEEYNLRSQMIRAATSIALNIAEGSTGQSDAEQARFISIATRSLVETVACLRLIERRNYLADSTKLKAASDYSEQSFAKLVAFRNTLTRSARNALHEDTETYE